MKLISGILEAVDKYMLPLSSTKTWTQISDDMWIRPYFDEALTKMVLVLILVEGQKIKLSVFKEQGHDQVLQI